MSPVVSTKPVSRFSAGLRFHQSGSLEQAEECYRWTLAEQPDHADALHLLGVTVLQLGRPDEALQAIQRAIEQQPGTPEFHNSLASAFRALGRSDEAVAEYRQCLEWNPDYVVALQNLAALLTELDRCDEAATCLQRVEDITAPGEFAESFVRAPKAEFNRSAAAVPGNDPSGQKPRVTRDALVRHKTVLHVGCGPRTAGGLHERFKTPDWQELRLDINPDVDPDVVASLTDMSAVECDSVDAVYSAHNLEHLYAHEVPIALAEFRRVLKPGGRAVVTMPDLQQVAHYIVADKLDDEAYVSPAGPITPLDCVFGYGRAIAEGNAFMAHKTGFTPTSLNRRLTEAGLVDVNIWTEPFAIWAEAYKPRT